MPSIEKLPVKELNEIDWNRIKEDQAIAFGLKIADLNDAIEHSTLSTRVFNTWLTMFVVIVLGSGVSLLFFSPTATLWGIVTVVVFNIVMSGLNARKAKKAAEIISKQLSEEASRLPKVLND